MKWFQQNRAFGILVIAFVICALLVGALFYWKWSAWTDAKQAFDQVAAERNRLQQLDPFPNDFNYRKLQGLLKSYTAALDQFKEQLKGEVAPVPPLAPNDFQSRLRLVVIATFDRARANNVKLPDNFELGFDEFARAMPDTAVTSLLGQELSQIQMLINILLDAKVDSVTALRRAPLPQEHGASPTPTPSQAAGRRIATAKPGSTPAPVLVERNIVDVTFKAAPGAARKVLNEIAASSRQFFIIRTLYVHNEKDKGPPHERGASPTPAPVAQASPGQPAAAGAALNFIVGNEHIEVSATIEMLRFSF
jgi:hypothetical protein